MPSQADLRKWKKRRQKVVSLRDKGWTFERIATYMTLNSEQHMTRQRASQIYRIETNKGEG